MKATEADIAPVMGVALECGLSAWSRNDYLSELTKESAIFLVANAHPKGLCGFILGRIIPHTNADTWAAEIHNIAVIPTARRLGIASRMMKSFLTMAGRNGVQNIFLEVRSSNREAIDFYKRLGFRIYSSRPSYYTDPIEDATLMCAGI